MYFIPPNPGNNPANPFYYRTMEEQRRELNKQVEGSSEDDIQEEQPGITAERQKDKMFSKPKPAKRTVPDTSIGEPPTVGEPPKGPDFSDGSGPKISGPIDPPDSGDGSDEDDEKKKDDKKGKPKGKPKGPKGPRPGAGGLGPRPSFGKAPGGPFNPSGRGRR